jgi:hypothetical protein
LVHIEIIPRGHSVILGEAGLKHFQLEFEHRNSPEDCALAFGEPVGPAHILFVGALEVPETAAPR